MVPTTAGSVTYTIDGLNRRIGTTIGSTYAGGFLYDDGNRVIA
jgi:hypothetical protein